MLILLFTVCSALVTMYLNVWVSWFFWVLSFIIFLYGSLSYEKNKQEKESLINTVYEKPKKSKEHYFKIMDSLREDELNLLRKFADAGVIIEIKFDQDIINKLNYLGFKINTFGGTRTSIYYDVCKIQQHVTFTDAKIDDEEILSIIKAYFKQ